VTSSPTVRAVLLATAVLVLVFVVALGSSRSLARVGGPGHLLSVQPIVGDLEVGVAVLALAVSAVLVYALWGGRPKKRRDDEPMWVSEPLPVPWWQKALALALALLPVAGLLTVLILTLTGRRGPEPVRPNLPAPGLTAPFPAPHPGSTAPVPAGGPPVHWWLWGALAGALAVAGLILLVRRRLRRSRDGGERAAAPRWLPAAIEESLAEIERERDPRRAVIRAYVSMERALARHGLGRRPFETPQEYLARVLVAIRISRPAGQRLTALFQRARFSQHPVDAQMKQDAISALVAVRDELAEQRQDELAEQRQ
jgi:hypothetical protein